MGVGLGTLVLVSVLLWRVWIVEVTLNERIDDIDHSLAVVVGGIIEKLETFDAKLPEINLINNDPLAQIINFFTKGLNDSPINSQPQREDSTGQFIEVESHATKEKENKTPKK